MATAPTTPCCVNPATPLCGELSTKSIIIILFLQNTSRISMAHICEPLIFPYLEESDPLLPILTYSPKQPAEGDTFYKISPATAGSR